MRGRGKLAVRVSGYTLLAICGISAFFLRDRILERWFLHRIATGRPRQIVDACDHLRPIVSESSIPALVRFARDHRRQVLEDNPTATAFFEVVLTVGPVAIVKMAASFESADEKDKAYGKMRPGELPLEPSVHAGLTHPDAAVRREAVELLGGPGEHDSDLEAIAPLIADPAPEVRMAVACSMLDRSPGDLVVRREVRRALRCPDVRLRRKAAEALKRLRNRACLALPELMKAMEDPDARVAKGAAEDLLQIGSGETLRHLRRAKERWNDIEKWKLVDIIERSGDEQVRDAFPDLESLLASQDQEWKQVALIAVHQLGTSAGVAPRRLLPFLKAPDPWVRTMTCWALSAMKGLAVEAIPELAQVLQDPGEGENCRRLAAYALAEIGPGDERVQEVLLAVLVAPETPGSLRKEIAACLGPVAMLSSDVFQALWNLVEEPPPGVPPWTALWALAQTGPRLIERLPVLLRLADPKCDAHESAALDCLAALGPDAAAALPMLESALLRAKGNDRIPIARALWKIDLTNGPRAVGLLSELLHEDSDFTLRSSASLLGEIGAPAVPAIPLLLDCLRDPQERSLPLEIEKALAAIGGAAVPALLEALRDPSVILRALAARALGAIGPAAHDALPALERVRDDAGEDDEVRREAAAAIGKIRPLGAHPQEGRSSAP